jgi:hypothetical protein
LELSYSGDSSDSEADDEHQLELKRFEITWLKQALAETQERVRKVVFKMNSLGDLVEEIRPSKTNELSSLLLKMCQEYYRLQSLLFKLETLGDICSKGVGTAAQFNRTVELISDTDKLLSSMEKTIFKIERITKNEAKPETDD